MSRMLLVLAITGLLVAPLAGAAKADDNITYTYDDYGRLLTVTYGNSTAITYSYDLAGNRLGQKVDCSSSGC